MEGQCKIQDVPEDSIKLGPQLDLLKTSILDLVHGHQQDSVRDASHEDIHGPQDEQGLRA